MKNKELKDLLSEEITLAIRKKDGEILTSSRHGVAALLDLLKEEDQPLSEAEVADRITGKASAMLLVKGKVRKLYSQVLSEKAIPVLEENGIEYSYGTLTDMIVNRDNTGMCPMEQTVREIEDIDEAVCALTNKVRELMAQ